MDPITMMAVGTAAASTITGLIGQAQASKDAKKQRELLKQAASEFQNIQNPEEKIEAYNILTSAGTLTPEIENEVILPDTEFKKIQADPRLKQAQMNALAKLSELGSSGGMDVMDQANIERAKQRAAAESSSQQAAIQESLARRGLQSAGQEMVQRQMAAQGQLNQLADFERQIQGEARRRALEAILKGGAMAGDLRNQDVGEQERRAAAIDRINQMRTANTIGLNTRNTDRINVGKEFNLRNDQRMADANVGIKNTELDVRRLAPINKFGRDIQRAGGVSGAMGGQAAAAGQQAQQTANMWGGLAQGVSQMGGAIAQGQQAEKTGARQDRYLDMLEEERLLRNNPEYRG